MNEGWLGDDYVVLFNESEWQTVTDGYGLEEFLPGYSIVGIIGWDDFVLRNEKGALFRMPSVPITEKRIEEHTSALDASRLVADERFAGRIKWYVKPLIFGGDPSAEQNTSWVDLVQHQELVRWWNRKYRETVG